MPRSCSFTISCLAVLEKFLCVRSIRKAALRIVSGCQSTVPALNHYKGQNGQLVTFCHLSNLHFYFLTFGHSAAQG